MTKFVSLRFKRAVVLHVIKNLLTQTSEHFPLLLGIHGPSGYGKTYQCEAVLQEIGAKPFLISGGQLESSSAGEPAQLVRRAYLEAGRCLQHQEAPGAVVLINDIDTGLGNWGDMVQYTINRQTVFGELMHLVDYPTLVEGKTTIRVPIIITGNDFTKLYEPLVRPGRMSGFEWSPTQEEKIEIVSGIYPELGMSTKDLVVELDAEASRNQFEPLSIAFFSHLRAAIIDDRLWKLIMDNGIPEFMSQLVSGQEPYIQPKLSFERVLNTGKELVNSGQLVNHLNSRN